MRKQFVTTQQQDLYDLYTYQFMTGSGVLFHYREGGPGNGKENRGNTGRHMFWAGFNLGPMNPPGRATMAYAAWRAGWDIKKYLRTMR